MYKNITIYIYINIFTISYSADKRLPEDFFKGVMEEKAEMLRRYLDDLGNPLILSLYCGHTMATFKFYSYNDNDDSLKLYYTFSNLGDFENQLYYLWIQLNQLLKGN